MSDTGDIDTGRQPSRAEESDGRKHPTWVLRAPRPVIALGIGVLLLIAGATGIVVIASQGPSEGVVLHPSRTAREAAPQALTSLTPLPCPTMQEPAVPTAHEFGTGESPVFVHASDQTGDGHHVFVEDVRLAQPGYVVVHDVECGQPGQIIGVTALLPAAEERNVIVPLATPLTPGAQDVFVMLHAEDDGNDTFDYPKADLPVTVNRQIVTVSIWVTVAG